MQQLHLITSQSFQRSKSYLGLFQFVAYILLIHLLLLSAPGFSATKIAKIGDVRIADRGTETRVVFDLSSPVKHSIFVLQNPDRVVLDIDQCDANGALKASRIGGTLVKELRYAQKTSDKLRVVFDLNTRVSPKSFY